MRLHNVFDKAVQADKKRRIPPQKLVGEFASRNTIDRLNFGDYNVHRKRLDYVVYAQKALAAKKRAKAATAGDRQNPPKEPAQHGPAGEKTAIRGDAEHRVMGIHPPRR